MSINSLCTNPKILNEFIDIISGGIGTEPIQTLSNTDNNVVVSTNGTEGTIDLNVDISCNSVTTTGEIVCGDIQSSSNLSITSLTNNVELTLSNLNLNVNNNASSVSLEPEGIEANLNFNNSKLKTNNLLNPFLTDGTDGQLIGTDGSNNIIWVDNGITSPAGLVSYIYNFADSQTFGSSETLVLFVNFEVPNFTVGKVSIVDISLTFFISSVATWNFDITVTLGINTAKITSLFTVPNYRIPRRIIVPILNTLETQELVVTLTTTPGEGGLNTFTVDTNDYISVNVSQIN
jgi:hypothetical protein